MHESVAPVIFARGGSKGLPRKNLANLGGKSLLRWSVEQGLSAGFSEIFVSTDSEEIAEEARTAGASVPFLRPSALATDDSPEWHSWQHFCSFLQDRHPGRFTHLLVLPTTAPLRSQEDLDNVISRLSAGESDVVVTMSPAHRHPQFNMVREDSKGMVFLYDGASTFPSRRQDVETVYDLTTVAYGSSIEFVQRAANMWQGRTSGVVVPRERAIDIDTEFDLEFAEFLLERSRADGS
jgi:N-acylneuraminate cytidylyltransferase